MGSVIDIPASTMSPSPRSCGQDSIGFARSDDPHDRARMTRRERVHLLGRATYVATVEDMIVTKLRWADSVRRTNVRNMLAVRGDELDWAYVHHWSTVHGTVELLERIRRSVPPI